MSRLERAQFVARPLEEVFTFFQRPENLATLTPPWLDFMLLSPSPVPMRKGQRLDYTIRPLGYRMRWTSVITDYDPPRSFTDEQVRGPYERWRHRHLFTPQEGGVVVRDEVDYALGFGALGAVAHAVYVRWALKAIFDFRARMIREVLG